MFPFINLFGRPLAVYGLLTLCGIFVAGVPACKRVKKAGFDDTDLIVMLLAAAAGAFAGGHLLYALVNRGFFPNLLLMFGGQVFYGGLLGALAAGIFCGRRIFRAALPRIGDILSPFIPLFHAFGRLGCFAAGCCYGVESGFGWTFHASPVPGANGVSRFPVQLAEAACNAALCALLFVWSGPRGEASPPLHARGVPLPPLRGSAPQRPAFFPRGKLLCVYVFLYAACRFVLEFFRGDGYRGFLGPLATSQWLSLFLAGGAAFALGRKRKTPRLAVLTGPRHAGKTSAGAALAALLGTAFYDLDRRIEEITGKSPRALYAEGKDVFRAAEAAALKTLLPGVLASGAPSSAAGPAVLAAGGGIIDNDNAMKLLNSPLILNVYLEVSARVSWKRISAGPLPPFLLEKDGDPANPKETHRLLHERRSRSYRAYAGLIIKADGKTPEELAGIVASALP